MAATTVITRAVKGSALTHNEMDSNWNNLNNVGVGIGHISIWPLQSVPDATWLPCEGGSYPTAAYPDLFNLIGYSYGGSGANFNVPDYRGWFLRGWSNGSGMDPDAGSRTNRGDGATGDIVGSRQEFAVQSHTHQTIFGRGPLNGITGEAMANRGFGADRVMTSEAAGGSETRPKNITVRFIIKALL